MKFNPDFSLVAYISERKPALRCFLVGVDGLAGSGKTTFARKLKEALQSEAIAAKIVAYDDGGFWIGGSGVPKDRPKDYVAEDYNWRRLRKKVLEPLRTGDASPYAVTIVEGCFTLRNELHEYYDLRVYVDVPREVAVARAIYRDDYKSVEYYETYWRVQEDRYLLIHQPLRKADLVIDGLTGDALRLPPPASGPWNQDCAPRAGAGDA